MPIIRNPNGSRVPVDSGDDGSGVVYLLSFPKCGRTWVRLMIGMVIANHFKITERVTVSEILDAVPLANYDPHIPTIMITHDDNPQWSTPAELQTNKDWFRPHKVMFLVRDPRDVVVSWYFQVSRRFHDDPEYPPARYRAKRGVGRSITRYEGDLSSFIRGDVGGIETIVAYYNVWAENHHLPRDFLLVSYEQLHADTVAVLRRICAFIDLPEVPDNLLERVVEFASFDNMRRYEATNAFRSFMLRSRTPDDPESYKIRKGKVGGFREYLFGDDLDYVNRIMRERLSPFYRYAVD